MDSSSHPAPAVADSGSAASHLADLADRLLRCPVWCHTQENRTHRAGEEDIRVNHEERRVTFKHFGPSWPGPLAPYGYQDVLTGDCEFHVAFDTGDLADDIVDPDELRTLAAQLTDAAEWLEGHQQQKR